MQHHRTIGRTRTWIAQVLAIAVLGTLLGAGGLVGAPAAGALDPSICRDLSLFPTGVLPEAVDDGGFTLVRSEQGPDQGQFTVRKYKYSTTWNTPLQVNAPGVLENDAPRALAILWRQPTFGTVALSSGGGWTYTPRLTGPPSKVEDSFKYIAYVPETGLCSLPATVTFEVDGFTEVLGSAPVANPDIYPSEDDAIPTSGPYEVGAPGVLANDYNNVLFEPASGLGASLVSGPRWLNIATGENPAAGTITNFGTRTNPDGTVSVDPGSFTFTPVGNKYGTAQFQYRACYRVTSTTTTACSNITTATINVAGQDTARPFQKTLGTDGSVTITRADFLANSVFDSRETFYPIFVGAVGGFADNFQEIPFSLNFGPRIQYFLSFTFRADSSFVSGSSQIDYIICNTPTRTATSKCTNESSITLVSPPPAPTVASVVVPTSTTGSVDIRFDRLVRGIDDRNIALRELRTIDSVPVPATVQCFVEIPQQRVDGTPLLDDGGSQVMSAEVQSCSSGTVSLVRLKSTSPLLVGRTYDVRLNIDDARGIVGVTDTAPPLAPFQQVFRVTAPDLTPPVASPTASVAPGTWSRSDVTVDWNWSDGLGSGIDPEQCTDSSTSTGQGVINLVATCTDRSGLIGSASFEVRVDKGSPAPNPVYSPAINQGWAPGPVTVTWNWADAGIGIDPAKCPATSTLGGEGLQSVLETCTDLLGNVGFGAASAAIDEIAPSASPTLSTPPGPSGWITSKPVTITWNWTDPGSGIDPANCPPTTSLTSDGAAFVGATCTDIAGNVGRAGGVYFVDTTAPTAAPVVTPRPVQGWSNGPVTITWNWSDVEGTGSGVDPAKCPATSTASNSGTVTATCTDLAGNTATATQRVDIDTTAPTAAPTAPTGWSRTDPTVLWNWSDTVGSGIDPTTCPLGTTATGDGIRTLTAACFDVAGNRGTASAEVKIDATAPTLAPTVTPNPVLLNGTATATANATDATSGIASQSCAPLRATTVGPATVACTATDVAGNTATATVPYVVGVGVRWATKPTSIWPDAGLRTGVAVRLTDAAGRTVPARIASRLGTCAVRFRLADQPPVCATYVPLTNTFAALVPTTRRLNVGTTVNLTATVTVSGTTVGTATAPVRVVTR